MNLDGEEGDIQSTLVLTKSLGDVDWKKMHNLKVEIYVLFGGS